MKFARGACRVDPIGQFHTADEDVFKARPIFRMPRCQDSPCFWSEGLNCTSFFLDATSQRRVRLEKLEKLENLRTRTRVTGGGGCCAEVSAFGLVGFFPK